jgi:hypothetical protein
MREPATVIRRRDGIGLEAHAMAEGRWSLWLLFRCENSANHPSDSQIGVAVIANPYYGPLVQDAMANSVCSICGSPFEFLGQESALLPYLAFDVERLTSMGFNIIKDEELMRR